MKRASAGVTTPPAANLNFMTATAARAKAIWAMMPRGTRDSPKSASLGTSTRACPAPKKQARSPNVRNAAV